MDATDYLDTYPLTPREMTMMMIQEVLKTTSITATAMVARFANTHTARQT